MISVPVKTLTEDDRFQLSLDLVAGEKGLARPITHARVQKPGLALAGFVQSVRPERVQVVGRTELEYLDSLHPGAHRAAIEGLLTAKIACVVVTAGQPVPADLSEIAEREAIPTFKTPLSSSVLITRVQDLLDDHLSPEIVRHGVLLDVFGVGVLLTGKSGVGKSECALDLVLRGHRLIGDDTVIIKRIHDRLVGSGAPITKNHMEVRGLGVINVLELFGAAAVRDHKLIEIVVDMVEWEPGESFDRTGLQNETAEFLEVSIPRNTIPIRPGRNMASIVEVSARNHLLKAQGHYSSREFAERINSVLAGPLIEVE